MVVRVHSVLLGSDNRNLASHERYDNNTRIIAMWLSRYTGD